MGSMDVILGDSHLLIGINICILMNVIAPKLEYAREVWEDNAKLVNIGNGADGGSKENTWMLGNDE